MFSIQVRSDWYVFAVLSSLPWVGKELYEKKDVEMDRIFSQIESYLKYVFCSALLMGMHVLTLHDYAKGCLSLPTYSKFIFSPKPSQ